MPSLQARHSRSCAVGREWSSFADAASCSCGPRYYVVVRDGRRARKTPVGKNRKLAERALVKVEEKIEDEGEYRAPQNIKFETWAEKWRGGLRRPGKNTQRSYVATMDYAKKAFGWKNARALGLSDVREFLALMEGRSPSTQAKHLRVLKQCLDGAISEGYASRNPVRELPNDQRPQLEQRERAYFETDELPKLFSELPDGLGKTICALALKTGMRQGELIALKWGNVSLGDKLLRVRENYTAGQLTTPKSKTSKRDVDLTDDAVKLLSEWWRYCGSPTGDGILVFPGQGASGYIASDWLTKRILYPAMERAGVPRVGPTGEKRTFHSFRHTFAKIALENGRPITWLSRHLGHSGVQVTDGVYGHFEPAARKAQVAELEGAFNV
jgi:integrase